MAKMSFARRASRFHAPHHKRFILVLGNCAFRKRRKEAWPARTRIEFRISVEQRSSATDTRVCARPFVVEPGARERALRPVLPRHVILLGRQFFAPFVVRLDDLPPRRRSFARHLVLLGCVALDSASEQIKPYIGWRRGYLNETCVFLVSIDGISLALGEGVMYSTSILYDSASYFEASQ